LLNLLAGNWASLLCTKQHSIQPLHTRKHPCGTTHPTNAHLLIKQHGPAVYGQLVTLAGHAADDPSGTLHSRIYRARKNISVHVQHMYICHAADGPCGTLHIRIYRARKNIGIRVQHMYICHVSCIYVMQRMTCAELCTAA